jgi:hypothetical protein
MLRALRPVDPRADRGQVSQRISGCKSDLFASAASSPRSCTRSTTSRLSDFAIFTPRAQPRVRCRILASAAIHCHKNRLVYAATTQSRLFDKPQKTCFRNRSPKVSWRPEFATHNGGSYFAVDRAKTGKAAVATLSRRTERLLQAYLNQLKTQKVELLDTAPIFRTRGAAPVRRPGQVGQHGGDHGGGRAWIPVPYTKDKLGRDFRKVRTAVFGPNEKRQIQDMRRSGTVEAFAGGAVAQEVSEKLANTLASSNRLKKSYNPAHVAKVQQVDLARRRGRNLLREQNEAEKCQLCGRNSVNCGI